jgi:hypothetical protein
VWPSYDGEVGQIVANALDTATGQDHGLLLTPN